jgi:lysozyme family protein
MANFAKALGFLLPHEGGFVNNKFDPGGATNFGISLYWLKSIGKLDLADVNHDGRIDVEDIKLLTPESAGAFYKRFWWDRYRYEELNDDAMASKIFDTAVNMGGIPCHKIAQRAASFCGYACFDDGILGDLTFRALNKVEPTLFLTNFRAGQANYYRSLWQAKPVLSEFRNGWLRRAAS